MSEAALPAADIVFPKAERADDEGILFKLLLRIPRGNGLALGRCQDMEADGRDKALPDKVAFFALFVHCLVRYQHDVSVVADDIACAELAGGDDLRFLLQRQRAGIY